MILKKLITYTGETQEHQVTHQNGGSHHLKGHLQLKAKEDVGVGESVMRGYQKKARLTRGKLFVQSSSLLTVDGLLFLVQ